MHISIAVHSLLPIPSQFRTFKLLLVSADAIGSRFVSYKRVDSKSALYSEIGILQYFDNAFNKNHTSQLLHIHALRQEELQYRQIIAFTIFLEL